MLFESPWTQIPQTTASRTTVSIHPLWNLGVHPGTRFFNPRNNIHGKKMFKGKGKKGYRGY
jgi:hypothetical protein